MNYQRVYDQIIDRAQKEKREKGREVYYERHHTVPKCLGGGNEKENLTLLTAREHFICHWLLCRIYPENYKIGYAFWFMSKQNTPTQQRDYIVSSRTYAEAVSNVRFTQEHKDRIGKARLGKKILMHPTTKEIRYVLQEELQSWIDLGWENTNGNRKRIVCECKHCGGGVTRPVSQLRSVVFCSRKCYLQHGGVSRGEVHIYQNNNQKFIPKQNLQEYLDSGWQVGVVTLQKRVEQYSLDGSLIGEYNSVREAVETGKFSCTGISQCANGKRKTHRGFVWRYKNTE